MVRLYVGGLDAEVTPELLSGRFKSFGTVSSCELARNKPGCTTGTPGACRGFAYVELEPTSEQALHRCLSTVRLCHWQAARCIAGVPPLLALRRCIGHATQQSHMQQNWKHLDS